MADDDEYIFDHRMGMRLRKPKADVNPNLPADVADAHRHKILSTVANKRIFADYECHRIEDHIDQVVATAITGGFRPATLDRAPLRTKYVFGEGFAYGREVSTQPGVAQEKVYPRGEVDPIPMWLLDMVIRPIVQAGIIPKDFVNSVTIVDCMPGGWITPHIDPTQIFDRPIVIASFVSDSLLSFGSKFTYLPQVQASPPVATVPLTRGNVLGMGGYAANNVDYCIRPEDVPQRQAVIILRRVSHTAPRLSATELVALRENGLLPKEGQLNEPAHRSLPPSPVNRAARSRSTSRDRSTSRERSRRRRGRSRSSDSSASSGEGSFGNRYGYRRPRRKSYTRHSRSRSRDNRWRGRQSYSRSRRRSRGYNRSRSTSRTSRSRSGSRRKSRRHYRSTSRSTSRERRRSSSRTRSQSKRTPEARRESRPSKSHQRSASPNGKVKSRDSLPPKELNSKFKPISVRTKGKISDKVPPKEMSSEKMPPKEMSSEKMPPKEMSSETMPPKEAISEKAPPKDAISEKVPPKDAISENDPPEGAILEKEPPKEVISKKDHPKEAISAKGPPALVMSSENHTPLEKTSEEISSLETSSEKSPSEGGQEQDGLTKSLTFATEAKETLPAETPDLLPSLLMNEIYPSTPQNTLKDRLLGLAEDQKGSPARSSRSSERQSNRASSTSRSPSPMVKRSPVRSSSKSPREILSRPSSQGGRRSASPSTSRLPSPSKKTRATPSSSNSDDDEPQAPIRLNFNALASQAPEVPRDDDPVPDDILNSTPLVAALQDSYKSNPLKIMCRIENNQKTDESENDPTRDHLHKRLNLSTIPGLKQEKLDLEPSKLGGGPNNEDSKASLRAEIRRKSRDKASKIREESIDSKIIETEEDIKKILTEYKLELEYEKIRSEVYDLELKLRQQKARAREIRIKRSSMYGPEIEAARSGRRRSSKDLLGSWSGLEEDRHRLKQRETSRRKEDRLRSKLKERLRLSKLKQKKKHIESSASEMEKKLRRARTKRTLNLSYASSDDDSDDECPKDLSFSSRRSKKAKLKMSFQISEDEDSDSSDSSQFSNPLPLEKASKGDLSFLNARDSAMESKENSDSSIRTVRVKQEDPLEVLCFEVE